MLTCAGRRNYLIAYFKEALGGRGEVYVTDNDPFASALQEADKGFTIPLVDHPSYIEELLSICSKHQVNLIIPLNDMELPILAQAKQLFHDVGTIPVVSSLEVINTCWDKCLTLRFAQDHAILTPLTFLTIESLHQALNFKQISFPLIVKPRCGTASIGIWVCNDKEELELSYRLARKQMPLKLSKGCDSIVVEGTVLIQEMLSGKEYGLDVINDLKGNHVCTFVKQKLAMRAGETDKAKSVAHLELARLGETIGQGLGHVGVLDCDVFVNDNGIYLLEMNPRFGGGYPFSHIAGANIPAALIAWAEGREPDPSYFQMKPGVSAAKCDRMVISQVRQFD